MSDPDRNAELHYRIINGLEDDFTRLATKAVIQKDQMKLLQEEYITLLARSDQLAQELKQILDLTGDKELRQVSDKENRANLANKTNLVNQDKVYIYYY